MNKKELDVLERAFEAEINAALEKGANLGIIQTKSKIAKKLEEEGYLKSVEINFKGVTIKGYALTLAGNAAYCFFGCNR